MKEDKTGYFRKGGEFGSAAELVWLLRLRQGVFFATESPQDASDAAGPAISFGEVDGRADSFLSVVTASSDADTETFERWSTPVQ